MMHLLRVVGSGHLYFIPNRTGRAIFDQRLLAAGRICMQRASRRQSGLCAAIQVKQNSGFSLRPICPPVKCREFPFNRCSLQNRRFDVSVDGDNR
jgi:hypothetical protein